LADEVDGLVEEGGKWLDFLGECCHVWPPLSGVYRTRARGRRGRGPHLSIEIRGTLREGG
jgi:hypothetical protein